MKIKKIFYLFLFVVVVIMPSLNAQSKISANNSKLNYNKFNFNNEYKLEFPPYLYLLDSVSNIKIFNEDKLKRKYFKLCEETTNCNCDNLFAIKVMEQRIQILCKITLFYRDNYITCRDIDCILLNFYLLTGVRHKSGADYFGWKPFSELEITQYKRWLNQNKEFLCIDEESRILYCRK